MRKKNILLIVCLVLLAGSGILLVRCSQLNRQLRAVSGQIEASKNQSKILDFFQLFVDKVLRSESEIDFETRLKLENAVRDTGDEEVINAWQRFVESKDEQVAQQEVKKLLSLLVQKVAR